MNWDEWRGADDLDAQVTLLIKTLFRVRGRKICLHKFVGIDGRDCYHTHPACAIRIILWGGYVEELEDGTLKTWRPGMVGLVRPEYSHRAHRLLNGRSSYSLWLRGRKCADIQLRGEGWQRVRVRA